MHLFTALSANLHLDRLWFGRSTHTERIGQQSK
jgi:hypothetical protein